ncbi:hypothetical protein BSPWISOXPB_7081 [uncultured Gammaproteobacteria bacterium]|nr:hypothetical protein BSPWISOXPB_7081 [uncultured Gammaproteobacteria bacterium]
MLVFRLGVVGILAREDVKVLTVYVDLSVICVGCVICVICITCVGLKVRANNSGGFVWSVKVVLAMVGVARVVIKVKIDIKMGLAFGYFNGFWWFFVLKIVVLFLMRGWSHVFTIKG